MTNKRIPDLTAATTPLAGTELVPVWDGTTTKQTTVAKILTPAAGNGIDFSAVTPAAGMTSQILTVYEEGTWTPTIRGSVTAGTESGSKDASYARVGNRVFARLSLSAFTLTGAAGNIQITGLPFSAKWNGVVAYAEGFTPAFTAAVGPGAAVTLSTTTSAAATVVGFRPSISATWDNYMTASSTWTGGGGSTYIHIELWGTI